MCVVGEAGWCWSVELKRSGNCEESLLDGVVCIDLKFAGKMVARK